MKLYNVRGEILIEGNFENIKELLQNNKSAVLRGAYLEGADLEGAVLRGADLESADLRDAVLRGADLESADLEDADLKGADLRDADLRDANLRGAYLEGADLRDANLRGADLKGADLKGAVWSNDIILENTIICIQNLKYYIYLLDNHIQIGCKLYSLEEWKNFTDEEIAKMDSGALEWWKKWKISIITMMEQKVKNDKEVK